MEVKGTHVSVTKLQSASNCYHPICTVIQIRLQTLNYYIQPWHLFPCFSFTYQPSSNRQKPFSIKSIPCSRRDRPSFPRQPHTRNTVQKHPIHRPVPVPPESGVHNTSGAPPHTQPPHPIQKQDILYTCMYAYSSKLNL